MPLHFETVCRFRESPRYLHTISEIPPWGCRTLSAPSAAERALGAPKLAFVAGNAYLLIALVARVACWLGCTSDNKLFHVEG